jgi:thiaminase
MRLSTSMRQAFVRAVMDDVPFVDYDEQLRQLAQKTVDSYRPAALVRALEIDPSIQDWLNRDYQFISKYSQSFCLVGSKQSLDRLNADPDFTQAAQNLRKQQQAQLEQRSALETKLKASAQACQTRAQLAKALPEFEKYLPIEAGNSKCLPALANLMSDFMAAGWPKKPAPAEHKSSLEPSLEQALA